MLPLNHNRHYMEVFQSEAEFQKMRKQNKFPKYESKNGITAFFAYLLSILIWIGILFIGVVALYTHWFSRSLVYLFRLIDPKPYVIPFWLSLIVVILAFPLSLIVIIAATLVKVLKG